MLRNAETETTECYKMIYKWFRKINFVTFCYMPLIRYLDFATIWLLVYPYERSLSIDTRHNSADSVPTSNLVCIKEVAIRTTYCIAGIIYYTCNLVTEIQCTHYKHAFNKCF